MISNSKVHYSWEDVENAVKDIHKQISDSNWNPDVIIGIANGGTIPATLFSKISNIPCKIITVQMRDGTVQETLDIDDIHRTYGKNILIVDEINDTGETLYWILNNWYISMSDIRIATLTYNLPSTIISDFYYWKIDKRINPVWCVYPWESFVDSDTI